jgi:hypothetical protein
MFRITPFQFKEMSARLDAKTKVLEEQVTYQFSAEISQ